MKTIRFFAVLAAASVAFACAPKANDAETAADPEAEAAEVVENAEVKNVKDLLPTKAETNDVSYLIGVNFGYFIKMNNFGEDLNYALIRKGMMDFINSEGNMQDPDFNEQFKVSPERMNELFGQYIQKLNDYKAEKNLRDGEKWLEKNAAKAGVVTTESGLQYKVIAEGDGTPIALNDTLRVYYKGTFIDGEQFDAREEGKDGEEVEPFEFELHGGYRGVIEGWVEGLQLVSNGAEVELYVPSELAYGKNSYNMEPNKTLIFNIKIVEVKKFVETEKAEETK